jgi:betaine-aldehyde dehydrogenase
LHESIHDKALEKVIEFVRKEYRPGVPTNIETTMGPVINKAAYDRVMSYIESAKAEGARLVMGGGPPKDIPDIKGGFFISPTIFTDVQPHFKIAREEIFGPVMAVFKWSKETELMEVVNSTPFGLTASVYTQSINTAQRIIKQVEAGFIWVNDVGRHFLGVPFGGYKESGIGREECLEELLSFTQVKSVNFNLS